MNQYKKVLGSFSIDDDNGDGSEKFNFLKNEFKFLQTLTRLFQFVKKSNAVEFPGVDFLGTACKFRKRKKNSSLIVHVLTKKRNWAFSRRSRAVTAKKCTQKRDAPAKLLFFLINLDPPN